MLRGTGCRDGPCQQDKLAAAGGTDRPVGIGKRLALGGGPGRFDLIDVPVIDDATVVQDVPLERS